MPTTQNPTAAALERTNEKRQEAWKKYLTRQRAPNSERDVARHGDDAPLWGGTAATFLAARDMWDEAARADGEGSVRAQAILDWRPSTRARYRSAITQLVETERQRPELGLQEVVAESLAARSGQGQSASGMCGIFAAFRALEDLCILPPTVLPLHRRIAGGRSQPKGQDSATPLMLPELWSAASTNQ